MKPIAPGAAAQETAGDRKPTSTALFVAGCLTLCLLGVACDERRTARSARAALGAPEASDEATAAGAAFDVLSPPPGIDFSHDNGATVDRLLPETMGSGVAVFDYDGDGRYDLFFVNGSPQSAAALYRNLGDGRFEDVTSRADAGVRLTGMGVAAADVDGDGAVDLFVSGVGGDLLLSNRGDGTFRSEPGWISALEPGFSSSAAFLDVDADGRLDLFVGRYVTWSPESDVACRPDGEHRTYCTPEVYPGASNRLLRNRGDRRGFAAATAASGLDLSEGKTLGVVPLDFDRDGLVDLAVGNDTVRNFLFRNLGGTFEEVGMERGIALSDSGAPRGAMGIDAGDLSSRGDVDLVIGNFALEMAGLYRNRGSGFYSDGAALLGLGIPTLQTLAFGTVATDLDLDGRCDIVFANGHIEPDIAVVRPGQSYAQPLQVFRQRGDGTGFDLLDSGELAAGYVGRGLATGDLDGDGDADLVLTQNGGRPVILANRLAERPGLTVRPVAVRSSPAFGTAVSAVNARTPSGFEQALVAGGSYLSASAPELIFAPSASQEPTTLDVRWPDGRRSRLAAAAAGGHTLVLPSPGG